MNVLLDSHILLWALTDDARLSEKARKIILDPENLIYFSAVSVWELTMKRLLYPKEIPFSGDDLIAYCNEAGLIPLDLTPEDAAELETLKRPPTAPRHKDPFDRMLISQAKHQDMAFLTHDELLPYYQEKDIIPV